MPIYEYACPKCEHEWSDLVASSKSDPPACPSCGATRSEKKFSVFASSVPSRGEGPGCGPGSCGCGRYQ